MKVMGASWAVEEQRLIAASSGEERPRGTAQRNSMIQTQEQSLILTLPLTG